MKNTKILLALIVCFSLSCSDMELVKPIPMGPKPTYPSPSYPGAGGSFAVQTTSLSTARSVTESLMNTLQKPPASYLVTQGGLTYGQLKNTSGSMAFNYLNNIRILAPTPIANFPYDAVRAQVAANLNKIQVTSPFKSDLLSSFDFMRTIDSKSYNEFQTYFENKLTNISTPPFGVSKMTELERFALTQAYYTVLNLTKYIYEHPTPPTAKGDCQTPTRDEWIQIAESAFNLGIVSGATLGATWAIAGAAATSVSGNPITGGLIGGLLGFTTGFIGGAVAGGSIKMLWNCISSKLFTPMMTLNCGGKTYYAATASAPLGCNEIVGGASITSGGEPTELRTILSFPLLPNKGKTVLNSTVVSDINWLIN